VGDFRPGDRVFVLDDPDAGIFQGIAGTVVEIGVACMMGEGMIVQSAEIGQFKGPYDMFGRVN
jgi:hypothetical protein